jgi:hypothetical protein
VTDSLPLPRPPSSPRRSPAHAISAVQDNRAKTARDIDLQTTDLYSIYIPTSTSVTRKKQQQKQPAQKAKAHAPRPISSVCYSHRKPQLKLSSLFHRALNIPSSLSRIASPSTKPAQSGQIHQHINISIPRVNIEIAGLKPPRPSPPSRLPSHSVYSIR